MNNEKFNIKGNLEKYSINNAQILDEITNNNENIEIEIILKKINNRNISEEYNNKYYIKLTNINKEFKNYLIRLIIDYFYYNYYLFLLLENIHYTDLKSCFPLNLISK